MTIYDTDTRFRYCKHLKTTQVYTRRALKKDHVVDVAESVTWLQPMGKLASFPAACRAYFCSVWTPRPVWEIPRDSLDRALVRKHACVTTVTKPFRSIKAWESGTVFGKQVLLRSQTHQALAKKTDLFPRLITWVKQVTIRPRGHKEFLQASSGRQSLGITWLGRSSPCCSSCALPGGWLWSGRSSLGSLAEHEETSVQSRKPFLFDN